MDESRRKQSRCAEILSYMRQRRQTRQKKATVHTHIPSSSTSTRPVDSMKSKSLRQLKVVQYERHCAIRPVPKSDQRSQTATTSRVQRFCHLDRGHTVFFGCHARRRRLRPSIESPFPTFLWAMAPTGTSMPSMALVRQAAYEEGKRSVSNARTTFIRLCGCQHGHANPLRKSKAKSGADVEQTRSQRHDHRLWHEGTKDGHVARNYIYDGYMSSPGSLPAIDTDDFELPEEICQSSSSTIRHLIQKSTPSFLLQSFGS